MLATILTLTGCPGPVNPDKPCTHEHTKTEVIEEATCTEEGLGKIVCVDCEEVLEEQKLPIDPEDHEYLVFENEKTHKCNHCENIAEHTFIAGGCECGGYQYSGTQVEVYVYIFTEDKELKDLGILYYSFEETDKTMELNNLLHLKSTYKDYTVTYCEYYFNPNRKDNLKNVNPYIPWEDELNSPIGIIIEPTN